MRAASQLAEAGLEVRSVLPDQDAAIAVGAGRTVALICDDEGQDMIAWWRTGDTAAMSKLGSYREMMVEPWDVVDVVREVVG